MKRVMAGITELSSLDQWAKFNSEVRLMLDSYHPYIGIVFRALSALDSPPDGSWSLYTARECGTSVESLWRLYDDLWWIARTKTKDRAHDIVLHVAETCLTPEARNLRGPMVWYQLEREHGGVDSRPKIRAKQEGCNPRRGTDLEQSPRSPSPVGKRLGSVAPCVRERNGRDNQDANAVPYAAQRLARAHNRTAEHKCDDVLYTARVRACQGCEKSQ